MRNAKVTFADKIGIPTLSISSCIPEVLRVLKTGKVPCLHGEAGIGKTASMNQLAKSLDKPIFTFVCSHLSETDMGIPFRSEGNSKYFDMLPPQQVYDAISSPNGAVLFFDEITRADKATLNAIFSVLSERKVGNATLGANVDIVCACNPDDGEYSVNDIIGDPAWRRRLVHMWLETDAMSWLKYARSSGMNKHVIDYIESKPDQLIGLEARAAGKIYPNPAAWETVSKYLTENNGHLSTVGLSGIVGMDTARDITSFIINTEYRVVPMDLLESFSSQKKVLDKIISDGRGDILGELVKAVALTIALNMPKDVKVTASNLFQFWVHIPEENAVLLNQELEKRNIGDAENYFRLLFEALKDQKDWSKHLQRLKGIIKIK